MQVGQDSYRDTVAPSAQQEWQPSSSGERAGEATLTVRCDPRDSMRSCVDAATTLLDRARSAMPSGGGPGGTAPGTPPAR